MANTNPAGAGNFGAAGWMSLGGSVLQIMAQQEAGRLARIQGERAKAMAQFEAFEADRRAGIAIAISQGQSLEEKRQATLVASRALAVSAASGAGVSDPTMVRVIANARGEGAVRAATALYEGQARSRALRTEAALGRLSGDEAAAEGAARQQGYGLASAGTGLRESASLYAKYGMRGPGTGPAGDAALLDAGSSALSPTVT